MTGSRTLTLLCLLPLAVGASERLLIRDGEYAFRHRSAEHPNLPAHPLVARISGTRIVLVNRELSSVFPIGAVAEGGLMWNGASKQWVPGQDLANEYRDFGDGAMTLGFREKSY